MTVLALTQGGFAFLGVLFVALCGMIYGYFTRHGSGIGPRASDTRDAGKDRVETEKA